MPIKINRCEIAGTYLVYYASTETGVEYIAIIIFPTRIITARKLKHAVYVYEAIDVPIMSKSMIQEYMATMVNNSVNEVRFSDKTDSINYLKNKTPKSAHQSIADFINKG
jgi:hypothetical protein